MDWIELLERYGVPLCVAVAFWLFIQKQNKYIQDDLAKDMHQKFNRLEGILIKLIDNSKKQEIKQEGLNRSFRTIVELMSALSGNGLKHRFLNMLNDNENDKD